jgi:zinc resistance-associated protein
MNKKNITITALAAALVLAMAAWSFAGPGYGRGCGGPGNGGPGNGMNNYYSQLTPEKQVAVDKIYEKYSPKFTELRNQVLTKRSTLQAMVNGGNADEQKIGKLTADISKLRTQMWEMRGSMSNELVKETGITAGKGYGSCPAYGQASCPGGRRGPGGGRGPGGASGQGNGQF